jgi:DNA-binding transcriptional ArsR family regulator
MKKPRRTRIAEETLAAASEVIKCIGHPLRLRLLEALESGEKSVSELQKYSGATQVMVSQQLTTLKARGVVESRRKGSHMYYRITEPKVSAILGCIRSRGPVR